MMPSSSLGLDRLPARGRQLSTEPRTPAPPPAGGALALDRFFQGPDRRIHRGRLEEDAVGLGHFSLAEPSPSSRIERANLWWRRRSRTQKAMVLAAASAGPVLAIGLGAGLSARHAGQSGAAGGPFAGSFSGNFSRGNLAAWNVSDNIANGGAFRCGFAADAIRTDGDVLQMSITNETVAGQAHGCGQLLHKQLFGFGSYSGLIQPLAAPGVVTGLFLYADTGNDTVQEIDIEFVGKDTRKMLATVYRDSVPSTQSIDLGFDASLAPHNYSFEYLADAVRWRVDGQPVHELTDLLPRTVPQHLYLNTWLREPSDWAGIYKPDDLPPSGVSHFSQVTFQLS